MPATDRSPIRVVGRYAIYNEIAAGGMATIHLGRLLGPVGFARTVAVKRLHPQYAKDPEFVSGFLDEARLAARVQHPNVVATIDVVATEGELFLIMDYVRGESLSRLLRTLRRAGERVYVPPRIASSIMCGFLHGLHAAHEAKNERGEPLGLVHRDVSPQNVLVGADGIPRVLDFGIAKAQGRIQVTRDGQIKGKLAYMPPEQLAGKELSRAVDIYASAVVMWEMLTTERLFKGETEADTLSKILRDPVAAPSALVPGLEPFDGPLLRALSRDASRRHATAKELALELERCVGIASPTEVGEWVEGLVGPLLVAREEQIAEIESNSASLRMKAELASHLDDSGSDRVAPSTHAVLEANASLDAAGELPTKIVGTPPAGPSPLRGLGGRDEPSEVLTRTATRTGTTFMLPVDRKVAVAASLAGVVFLIVIVAVVLGGVVSRPAAKAAPAASLSVEPPRAETPDAGEILLADPLPDPGPAPTPEAPKSDPPRPRAVAAPHPKVVASAPLRATAAGVGGAGAPQNTAGTGATAGAAGAAGAAGKKNCDPPYTLDAQGRKKYKLECM